MRIAQTARTKTSTVIHIQSGGAEKWRALCGAKLALTTSAGATCTRCIEKAERLGVKFQREKTT